MECQSPVNLGSLPWNSSLMKDRRSWHRALWTPGALLVSGKVPAGELCVLGGTVYLGTMLDHVFSTLAGVKATKQWQPQMHLTWLFKVVGSGFSKYKMDSIRNLCVPCRYHQTGCISWKCLYSSLPLGNSDHGALCSGHSRTLGWSHPWGDLCSKGPGLRTGPWS